MGWLIFATKIPKVKEDLFWLIVSEVIVHYGEANMEYILENYSLHDHKLGLRIEYDATRVGIIFKNSPLVHFFCDPDLIS